MPAPGSCWRSTLSRAPNFINDVVLTPDYAWFTDSLSAQLYGVPLGPGGELGDPADVVTLPLTGDWAQASRPALMRMASLSRLISRRYWSSTPRTGFLYRVDPDPGSRPRWTWAAPYSPLVTGCW